MSYDLKKLHADIAQVQRDGAGFATGRLVARNLVLTAAHVLQSSSGSGPVLDEWQVRLAWDRGEETWRFRRGNPVIWRDEKLDLALIQIVDFQGYPIFPKLDFRVADISTNGIHRVEARGYSRASKEEEGSRELTVALGRLSASEMDRPFRFGVERSDLPNDPRVGWRGMSGSAVMLHDTTSFSTVWIYGVVQSVPANFDGQLRVSRLATAWADSDFRRILVEAGAPDADAEDVTTSSEYRFHKLVPSSSSYHHSVLAMIISNTLDRVPVHSLASEAPLPGYSLTELYKAVETLIDLFQNLCDEIAEALHHGGIKAARHQSVYGSAWKLGETGILKANRKLSSIAMDMREIATSLGKMLPEGSVARERFGGILQICASISIAEDFLVVELGIPDVIAPSSEPSRFGEIVPGRLEGVEMHGNWDGSAQLPEYARLQSDLEKYKRQLRAEVARLSSA